MSKFEDRKRQLVIQKRKELFSCPSTVKEDSKESKLICRLAGFNPSSGGHSAYAQVNNNVLVVTAHVGDRKYELKVNDIGVSDDAVSTKPAKDEIKVVITKPSREYSLAGKLPK